MTVTFQRLTVDGMLSGTGVRDLLNGGYIDLIDLGLSDELVVRIKLWLELYADAHYHGFIDQDVIASLDTEGAAISNRLGQELPASYVEYFSASRLCRVPCDNAKTFGVF